ncbi:hypothetical protein GQX74_013207 [Glossina fuscipes]|nr:hypothetical protein GQX74_013207 [Glossina fuscipes]
MLAVKDQLDFGCDDAECELNCKPAGMKYFAALNNTVIDGKICYRPAEYYRYNYQERAVCVNGICKRMGSREDAAAKVRADTQVKLSQMVKAIANRQDPVIKEILQYIYQIKPEKCRNFQRK